MTSEKTQVFRAFSPEMNFTAAAASNGRGGQGAFARANRKKNEGTEHAMPLERIRLLDKLGMRW